MGYVIWLSPTYHFRDASPNTHDIWLGLKLLQDGRHLVWAGHCYGDFGLTYSPFPGVRGDWRSFFFVFEGSEPNMLFSGNRWKRQNFFSKRRDGDSHDASITAQTPFKFALAQPWKFYDCPMAPGDSQCVCFSPYDHPLMCSLLMIFPFLLTCINDRKGGRSDTLRFPGIGVPPNHPL